MTERGLTPAEQARSAYNAAVRILVRRDHSVVELCRKLRTREHEEPAIDAAVQELLADNYLNDTRYAELYTEQRISKGYGPLAIRAKLRERGIDSHLTQRALDIAEANWPQLAAHLIHKRFNAEEILGADQRSVARIARFVQGRGFSSSDAAQGLKAARSDLKER